MKRFRFGASVALRAGLVGENGFAAKKPLRLDLRTMSTPPRGQGRKAFIRDSLLLSALGVTTGAAGVNPSLTPATLDRRAPPQAWRPAVTLDHRRQLRGGSWSALVEAVRAGADLRMKSEFYHHEHIEPGSSCRARVEEMMDWRVTQVMEGRWVSACANLRQPISLLGNGFGPDPSLSLFLYNQDGQQAVARLYLDGKARQGARGPGPVVPDPAMPKYHLQEVFDAGTNAPSRNFIYDFESLTWFVRTDWTELYSHTANGQVRSGSRRALIEAFQSGCELKVAVEGLCDDLVSPSEAPMAHETFVHGGATYCYLQEELLSVGSQPVVRVRPGIPTLYRSGGWDYGWLYLRTDGQVTRRLLDPYTRQFTDSVRRHALRWFAR